jgi:RNA polymerase sigma factor (sigma-70 family)
MRGGAIQYPAPESTATARGQLQEERHVIEYVMRTVLKRATATGWLTLKGGEAESLILASIARGWNLWDPAKGSTKRAAFLSQLAWRDYLKAVQLSECQCRDWRKTVSLDAPLAGHGGRRVLTLVNALPGGTDPTREVLEEAGWQEVRERLRAGLELLSPDQASVLYGLYWRGMTLQQIGDELGFSRQWAQDLKKRGLERLREMMDGVER